MMIDQFSHSWGKFLKSQLTGTILIMEEKNTNIFESWVN